MSGTYNAGSDFAVPGQLTTVSSVVVPIGTGNVGTGTLTNLASNSTTSTIHAGVYKIECTTASTSGTSSTPGTYTISGNTLAGPITPTTRMATRGTPANLMIPALNIKFTLTDSNSAPFAVGDGFLLYVSQLGQNSTAVPPTGISVTVQQFLSASTTAPATWGAVIQAMFNYCGANPGIIGIIPPGFYDCSDVPQLNVVSNMTISAYGATLFTSMNSVGAYGFLTVPIPRDAVSSTKGIHDVTIMGGTWGGSGINGATCTDNSAIYGPNPRTGSVVSIFAYRNITLVDMTARGWSQGLAFYLFVGSNIVMKNCSFWNSDGVVGSGGIRVANGDNVRITNSNGISGDDCLQFATPGSGGVAGPGVSNAFFIGGNVQSLNARAFVATLVSGGMGSATDVINSYIEHVGFVGINGSIGPSSTAACFISNQNSTKLIQDLTIKQCNLSGPPPGTANPANTIMLFIQCAANITGTTNCGGIQDVYISELSISNYQMAAVDIEITYNKTETVAYNTIQNVNFRNCVFYAPSSSPATATVYIKNANLYRLSNCTIYSNNTSCLVLGAPSANPPSVGFPVGQYSASHGAIDGCTFYTYSATAPLQPALIFFRTGDMVSVQGWSKLFLGVSAVSSTGAGNAVAGIEIGKEAANAFVDNIDARGLSNTSPTFDLGTHTRLGQNIIALSGVPTGGLTLSRTTQNVTGASVSWSQQSIVLELGSTSSTVTTVNLPSALNDGEVRILASPKTTFGTLSLNPAAIGFSNGQTFAAGSAIELIWDRSGSGSWLTTGASGL